TNVRADSSSAALKVPVSRTSSTLSSACGTGPFRGWVTKCSHTTGSGEPGVSAPACGPSRAAGPSRLRRTAAASPSSSPPHTPTAAGDARRPAVFPAGLPPPEVAAGVLRPDLVLPGVAADRAAVVLGADARRCESLLRPSHFFRAGDAKTQVAERASRPRRPWH